MRKSVLAIAAAGSIFAGTAAAASVSISPADSQTLNKASVGSQTVEWNTCAADTFDIAYTQNTTVGDADYLKVTGVTISVQATSEADLANCDLVNFQIDSGSWASGVSLAAATGADTSWSRTTTLQSITATDSVASVSVEFKSS